MMRPCCHCGQNYECGTDDAFVLADVHCPACAAATSAHSSAKINEPERVPLPPRVAERRTRSMSAARIDRFRAGKRWRLATMVTGCVLGLAVMLWSHGSEQ